MTADARPADRAAECRDFGIDPAHGWPPIVFSRTVRFQRVWVGGQRARYVDDDGLILDIFEDDARPSIQPGWSGWGEDVR